MHPNSQETIARLHRIQILYTEIKEAPLPTLKTLRSILFDATASTSQKERALLALIDHPDHQALALLEHRALSFQHPRLQFTHTLARRRCRAKLTYSNPCAGADAA